MRIYLSLHNVLILLNTIIRMNVKHCFYEIQKENLIYKGKRLNSQKCNAQVIIIQNVIFR